MTQQNTFDYPETARADTVDTLHGIQVPDPYRWLEEIDSDQTQAWIAEQNRLTFDYLSQIPARARKRHSSAPSEARTQERQPSSLPT